MMQRGGGLPVDLAQILQSGLLQQFVAAAPAAGGGGGGDPSSRGGGGEGGGGGIASAGLEGLPLHLQQAAYIWPSLRSLKNSS